MKLRMAVRGRAVDVRYAGAVMPRIDLALDTAGIAGASVELVPLGPAATFGDIASALEHREADIGLAEATTRGTCSHVSELAWLTRDNPRYGLVTKTASGLDELPEGSRVRACDDGVRAQIAVIRPDVQWVDLTGDVPTRLHKVHLGEVDGIVEPVHHLRLLGLADRAFSVLPVSSVTPAPGQGAWVILAGVTAEDSVKALGALGDEVVRRCVALERTTIRRDDRVIAAWARKEKARVRVEMVTLSEDGTLRRGEQLIPWDEADEIIAHGGRGETG